MDLYNFKRNKIVRIIALPFINFIRYQRKIFYRFTYNAKMIRNLKNTHIGERCFIIGNGPSLTVEDLDSLRNEFCFAANRIYRVFDKTKWRPQIYLCVDSFVLKDLKDIIRNLELPVILLHLEAKKYKLEQQNKNILYINNFYPFLINQHKYINGIKVSSDVSKYFTAGETVTFNSIQLAFYMGFKEIYLLGVDHQYSKVRLETGEIAEHPDIIDYFDRTPAPKYSVQNVATSTAAYVAANKYALSHHIVLKNLTRGGALEVFQRGSLDDII